MQFLHWLWLHNTVAIGLCLYIYIYIYIYNYIHREGISGRRSRNAKLFERIEHSGSLYGIKNINKRLLLLLHKYLNHSLSQSWYACWPSSLRLSLTESWTGFDPGFERPTCLATLKSSVRTKKSVCGWQYIYIYIYIFEVCLVRQQSFI